MTRELQLADETEPHCHLDPRPFRLGSVCNVSRCGSWPGVRRPGRIREAWIGPDQLPEKRKGDR